MRVSATEQSKNLGVIFAAIDLKLLRELGLLHFLKHVKDR
jgi:hypothetical protein